MITTTTLSSYETTNVTDKDLLQLINTYKSIPLTSTQLALFNL